MINMTGDGVHVSRSMVFQRHMSFRDGRESIDPEGQRKSATPWLTISVMPYKTTVGLPTVREIS